jgi:Carbohydrate family 9 binding domain-like
MQRQRLASSWAFLAAILLAASSTSGFAEELNQRLQIIPATRTAPTIDGKLDDAAWKDVKPFSAFLVVGTEKEASVQTEVKAVFRRGAIYFGIKCFDPDTAKLMAKATERDGAVGADDAVEIFINPEGKGFYQLLVNSKGTRADLAYPAPKGMGKLAWNPSPDWKAVSRVSEGYWVTEIEIPFKAVWPWKFSPVSGEHFQLKVCRTILNKDGDAQGNVSTAWNKLAGKAYNSNSDWRLVRLGGPNLLRDADFSKWVGRKPNIRGKSVFLTGKWRLELPEKDGEPIGAWELVKDPEPGISHALKITRLKKAGQNPRLFILVPLRPGHRYRFSAKVKGNHAFGLSANAKPWVRHFGSCFTPPEGGWKTFTDVSKEFEVGKDSGGNETIKFIYLWLNQNAIGEYLLADARLEEIQSVAPPKPK